MAEIASGYGYGLRDVKITSIDGATQVDLPAAMKLTWKETSVNDVLRGDDVKVSIVSFVEGGEFEIEAGGVSMEVYAMLTGETVASAGTTPNRTDTITRVGGTAYPYVKIYGRALGDNSDGLHIKLLKAKLTALEGNMGNQEFVITKCSGEFVQDASGNLYDLVKLETDTTLPTS